ncbi:putative transmembrane protein [Paratrimastix pyriformis]|uniref:Transmembrane protein n=1 Tax=Paratrimastix pyriformis TaxID=342808 RepID=A0ABQ8UP43_9EUKA|nr:putative transmembrane protein [Paratrimastix pyriformis]
MTAVSGVASVISVAAFFFQYFPQLILNHRRRSVEGISLPGVLLKLLGATFLFVDAYLLDEPDALILYGLINTCQMMFFVHQFALYQRQYRIYWWLLSPLIPYVCGTLLPASIPFTYGIKPATQIASHLPQLLLCFRTHSTQGISRLSQHLNLIGGIAGLVSLWLTPRLVSRISYLTYFNSVMQAVTLYYLFWRYPGHGPGGGRYLAAVKAASVLREVRPEKEDDEGECATPTAVGSGGGRGVQGSHDVVLSCGHSICRTCAIGLARENRMPGTLECPTCRQSSTASHPLGPSSFTSNFGLADVVEEVSSLTGPNRPCAGGCARPIQFSQPQGNFATPYLKCSNGVPPMVPFGQNVCGHFFLLPTDSTAPAHCILRDGQRPASVQSCARAGRLGRPALTPDPGEQVADDAAHRPIQIFVRSISGKSIAIEVDCGDNVRSVMEKIEEKEGFPPTIQRLLFAGHQLEEDRSLASYGVEKGFAGAQTRGKDLRLAPTEMEALAVPSTSCLCCPPTPQEEAKHPKDPRKWKLVFGSHTWIVVMAFNGPIILGWLYLIYWLMGPSGLRGTYNVIFGYFILTSIHIAHYWNRPHHHVPDPRGFYTYAISAVAATFMFYVHTGIFKWFVVDGVEGMTLGHFAFIIIGFYIAGYDDGVWDGKLTCWIPWLPGRSIFWYAVTWLCWFLLYGLFVQHFFAWTDANRAFAVLAIVQWTVMQQFTYSLALKEPSMASKWPLLTRQPLKGLFLTCFHAAKGFAWAYAVYGLECAVWGETSPPSPPSCLALTIISPPPPLQLTPAQRFDHDLGIATYPLLATILGGLLTHYYSGERHWFCGKWGWVVRDHAAEAADKAKKADADSAHPATTVSTGAAPSPTGSPPPHHAHSESAYLMGSMSPPPEVVSAHQQAAVYPVPLAMGADEERDPHHAEVDVHETSRPRHDSNA